VKRPPDCKRYLCLEVEDDSAVDCEQCWDRYLWGLADGSIEPQNKYGVIV